MYNTLMHKLIYAFIISMLLLSVGCAGHPEHGRVGADRDSHGCIGTAGYTWSSVRQQCVRLWEEGFALFEQGEKDPSSVTYVILDKSLKNAEIFLPVKTKSLILSRTAQDEHEWTFSRPGWKLIRTVTGFGQQENWQLFEKQVLVYEGSPARIN